VTSCPHRDLPRGGHSGVEVGVSVCSPGRRGGEGPSLGGAEISSTITAPVMKGRRGGEEMVQQAVFIIMMMITDLPSTAK